MRLLLQRGRVWPPMEGARIMNRRIALALAAALGSTLAFPFAARADQAIMAVDGFFEIGPGEVVDHADVLIMSTAGIPTVIFDGSDRVRRQRNRGGDHQSQHAGDRRARDGRVAQLPDDLRYDVRRLDDRRTQRFRVPTRDRAPLHRADGRGARMRRPPRRTIHDPPRGERDIRRVSGDDGVVLRGRLSWGRVVRHHVPACPHPAQTHRAQTHRP